VARAPGRRAVTGRPPPPRYRVVEKGRRLIVIDTRSGQPADGGRGEPRDRTRLGPERIAFDGRAVLTTRPLYDDKAPRRLLLDEATARWLEAAKSLAIGAVMAMIVLVLFAPVLASVPVIATLALLNPKVRALLRVPVTAWLDQFDAG